MPAVSTADWPHSPCLADLVQHSLPSVRADSDAELNALLSHVVITVMVRVCFAYNKHGCEHPPFCNLIRCHPLISDRCCKSQKDVMF